MWPGNEASRARGSHFIDHVSMAEPEIVSEPQSSAPKRQKLADEAKGKHATGYKAEWKREFSWVEPVRNERGEVVGLYCKLCKRHKRKNKYNQCTVWSETPCTTIPKDAVCHHSLSQQHKAVVEMEACQETATRTRGIQQALQTQLQLKKEAVKTAMQCLYWLVKSEILHTGHYNSLLSAVQFMGCEQLKHLNQGENAKYTSQ